MLSFRLANSITTIEINTGVEKRRLSMRTHYHVRTHKLGKHWDMPPRVQIGTLIQESSDKIKIYLSMVTQTDTQTEIYIYIYIYI